MVKNLKRIEKASFGLVISSHSCFLKPQENVTIRVRRSSLGRLWSALGAHAGLRTGMVNQELWFRQSYSRDARRGGSW